MHMVSTWIFNFCLLNSFIYRQKKRNIGLDDASQPILKQFLNHAGSRFSAKAGMTQTTRASSRRLLNVLTSVGRQLTD